MHGRNDMPFIGYSMKSITDIEEDNVLVAFYAPRNENRI